MPNRTKVLKEVTCIRCHKKIKKGGFAIRVQSGFSPFPFFYCPSCHAKDYAKEYDVGYRRYAKKSNIKQKVRVESGK
jgi:hypothetical protein